MADLDDFFAKKDRKKSKGKKFMTTEEIAKKLEETGKKSDKLKKDKPIIQSSINAQEGDDLSEDEWKNFEEEKKDYSGLKIQNLTLEDTSDSENNDGESDRAMDDDGSGEVHSRKKGPWKVVDVEQTPNENSTGSEAAIETATTTTTTTTAPSVEKMYIPPFRRHQNLVVRDRPPRNKPNKPNKPNAPDINNQEFFPTLSAAKSEPSSGWSKRNKDGAFEEVRNSRSHSNRSDPSQRQQNLQIGNKFGALESEQS